jgi:formamidopyrimidine-DNA glycosylase
VPELPEVYTIGSQLAYLFQVPFVSDVPSMFRLPPNPALPNWKDSLFQGVEFITPAHIMQSFDHHLLNMRIESIGHTGKLLVLQWNRIRDPLERPMSMFVHFAMTGGFTLERQTYSRLRFDFGHGRNLFFNDMRKWGKIGLDIQSRLKNVGRSVFEISDQNLMEKARRRQGPIRDFLLDQSVTPGIGNYLVNEILWEQKIHPATPANKLTIEEWGNLLVCVREIIVSSIAKGGMSMSDYFDLNRERGGFQNFLRCYQRQNCPRCSSKIVRLDFDGSGNYTCLNCQSPKT